MEPEETVIARQGHGKHVPSATNTHSTIEEFLGVGVFCSVHIVSNIQYVVEGKWAINYLFPEILVEYEIQIGKLWHETRW